MADVKTFNEMYGLPVAAYPGVHALPGGDPTLRLSQLKTILQAELDEIEELIKESIDKGPWSENARAADDEQMLKLITGVADLMTDLVVYAQSEMVKWGIPISEVFELVMASNASKMGPDGKPIIQDGKLIKGPNYWKPEPAIYQLLRKRRAEALATGQEPAPAAPLANPIAG